MNPMNKHHHGTSISRPLAKFGSASVMLCSALLVSGCGGGSSVVSPETESVTTPPFSANWWLPDDVAFVEELPHTATGKVSKARLRERFKDYELPTA